MATSNSLSSSSSSTFLFDRPDSDGEKAVLVQVDFGNPQFDEDLEEFVTLVTSAGIDPLAVITGSRKTPDSKYFVGTGKVDEIAQVVQAEGADLVLFNHPLSPSQERNLERALTARVFDRATLILDIFAQRARTFEGKLQVELAQLRHMSTRLVRGWTHLERQKGGIGLRGPGETQLETDRRLLGIRIKQLNRRLEKVRKQRDQGRASRRKAEIPTVSVVGYTNAGKSTLFNSITNADVYAADQLFATLDPTLRGLKLEHAGDIVLADTVGFIRDLPHDLVAAFRSTLQETLEADLLLHVIDATNERREDIIEQVNNVLGEIGAQKVPQLLVMNKIDLWGMPPKIDRDDEGKPTIVWVSALNKLGLDLLIQALDELLAKERVIGWLELPPNEAKVVAQLHELDGVKETQYADTGHTWVRIDLDEKFWNQLNARRSTPLTLLERYEN